METQYLTAGLPFPVKISTEPRRSSRVTIRSGEVHIQLPNFLNEIQREKNIQQLLKWAKRKFNQLEISPKKQDGFYQNGGEITVLDEVFKVVIEQNAANTTLSKLNKREKIVTIKVAANVANQKSIVQKALSRIFSIYSLSFVEQRLHELNNQFFKKPLGKISLRHNHSRWGSCSSNTNISISSRLLLAPKEVRDYVFIHELAHLQEMNHSSRFWNLVANAMPDYDQKEQWLDTKGLNCDF